MYEVTALNWKQKEPVEHLMLACINLDKNQTHSHYESDTLDPRKRKLDLTQVEPTSEEHVGLDLYTHSTMPKNLLETRPGAQACLDK